MSSRAPNAPPTPPSTSRTFSSGRPRQAAICLRSSCSHCVATCSSTPRAARVGHRQRRLETEERLVLHADLVGALDDDVAGGVGVAAARSRWWRRTLPSGWIGGWLPSIAASGSSQRLEHLVGRRRSRRAPAGRSRGGRRRRRRRARRRSARRRRRTPAGPRRSGRRSPAGHVVGGDHGVDARDRQRRRHVDRDDAGVRVRRAQRGAPRRAVDRQVGRERERALGLGDRRPGRAGESPMRPVPVPRPGSCRATSSTGDWLTTRPGRGRAATCCTAAMMRP